MKRLGQVIIRARFQAFYDALLGVLRGEQKDVRIGFGPVRPHFPADIDAVLPGHHPIEQGNARRVRCIQLLPGAFAILCRDNVIAPFRKESLQHPARDGLVIGDQDLHFETSWQKSASTGSKRSTAASSAPRFTFDDSASPFFALCSRRKAESTVTCADILPAAPFMECADRSSKIMSPC